MSVSVRKAHRTRLIQALLAFAVCVAPHAPLQAQSSTLALSDVPLFLLESVSPNLAITFDDSGSMLWGYLPDAIEWDEEAAGTNGAPIERRATRSSFYNKIYYDPSVDYRPGLDANGASLGEANFNNAFTNIYNYNQDAYNPTWRPVSVNLQTNFRPVWNTSLQTGWGPRHSAATAGNAHYFIRDESLAGCSGADLDDACYQRVDVSATSGESRARPEFNFAVTSDERTNFANWYQYYSYRFIAGKTVLSRAFAPENLSSSIRVARQTLNQRTLRSGNPGATNDAGDPYVSQFTQAQRTNFYNWLSNIGANGGTPLRAALTTAGNYFATSGTNSPYSENPGDGSAAQVSCRLNAHILLSDGYYNGTAPGAAGLNRDQSTVNFPDSTTYDPNSPLHNIYADTQPTVTLADLAFHYWATDLNAGLTNNVAAYFPQTSGDPIADYWNPVNDPATWQHMVTYPIAFGIAGLIPFNDASYQALLRGDPFTIDAAAGSQQSGWTSVATEEGKADDMWHAAINSRGQFFSASKPDELVNSLVSVMNAIADRESSAASVDLNSSSIAAGVGVYQARFFTDNWTGDVQGRPISDGSNSNACNSNPIASVCAATWSASDENKVDDLFPGGVDQRIVFTTDPNGALGSRGNRFRWANLSAAQQSLIQNGDSAAIAQARLEFLRGSAAGEQRNGGTFRTRDETRLGAVVHAAPKYVGNGFDASGSFDVIYPDDLESTGITHKNFLCSNATDTNMDGIIDSCSSGIRNSRTPIVYVGANDGMLHAYDARLNHTNGGKELFNFIPNTVIENLHELSNITFTTGSYVDGDLASADVFYSGAWHTVLVGGLRTGGQAYYALDVTNPGAITSETTAAANQLVRWEFTDTNTSGLADGTIGANGDRDLGFTFGQPEIVKVNYTAGGGNTGRWVAIFGNGYNANFADGSASTTGNAVLYVVDIETGLLISKLDTGEGTAANPNGISGIAPILNDSDLTVDYVYAGDLYGNLWKFDISSTDVADWGVAYSVSSTPAPLFEATDGSNAQPIQSTPRVSRHFQGGNLVYFGTGKYLEDSDNATVSQQSFYGIWDKDICSVGGAEQPCSETVPGSAKVHVNNIVARGDLRSQSVTVNGANIRESSDNQVNWSSQLGWYIDFPVGEGERALGTPVLRGEIVIFTTLEPDDTTCEAGGGSWIYALDRIDGGKPPVQVFDHNGDGEIDGSDYAGISSATHIDAVISDPTYAEGADGKDYVIYGSSDLGGLGGGVDTAATPDTTIEGRVRWRQLN